VFRVEQRNIIFVDAGAIKIELNSPSKIIYEKLVYGGLYGREVR